jgi:hypothetical protein
MVETAIFLGAGASKAEGAPLQGELLREYFLSPFFKKSIDPMDRELANFFLRMFQIDVYHSDISRISFPTFEEVLGLTDLAIMRRSLLGISASRIESRIGTACVPLLSI